MEKDYVTYLQENGEPEQENCSSGLLPVDCATESYEDGKTQEILVPVLTSMSKYLFKNYRLTMYCFLNRSLKSGNLESIVGFRIKNRVIDRNVCSFGHPTFWRANRETFIANVRVTLCLDTANGNRTWEGFISMWFEMGETVSCSVEYMGSIEEMEDENLPMLSSYLVPIFSNRQMDDEAEAIWAKHLPEALQHPEKRSALALAKKMGLSIQHHPVFRHKETASILFFEQGELTVWDEHTEDADKKEPISVTIPANTIVINTNVIQERYSGFQIYHECIHFEEHYLFSGFKRWVITIRKESKQKKSGCRRIRESTIRCTGWKNRRIAERTGCSCPRPICGSGFNRKWTKRHSAFIRAIAIKWWERRLRNG